MPINGGEIKQLTFHDAGDLMDSWSWDSKSIYFTSGREGAATSFKVSIDGGTPVRVFSHYFNQTHNLSEHPTTGELFFNDTWESSWAANRKGTKATSTRISNPTTPPPNNSNNTPTTAERTSGPPSTAKATSTSCPTKPTGNITSIPSSTDRKSPHQIQHLHQTPLRQRRRQQGRV